MHTWKEGEGKRVDWGGVDEEGGHTLHVKKAGINMEKHTYSKAADLRCLFYKKTASHVLLLTLLWGSAPTTL